MLSKEQVLKIANLARIHLTDDEVDFFQKKLGVVLEHVNELSPLNAPQDELVRHIPIDAKGARNDKRDPFVNPNRLLDNAPATSENQFLLPPVMD